MDISNLTIPPDLFYSKNPSETWKPRCLSKIKPNTITESTKSSKPVKIKKVVTKRKIFKKSSGPQLGRIEKVRNAFVKKKLIKKKTGVLQEKSQNIKQANNNNTVKLPTKKEEVQLQKEIKAKEEELQKRLFVDENRVLKVKRRKKGSGFKFFKSKNNQEEEENESEQSDNELVPEIRDFTPPSSADTSRIEQIPEKTPKLVIDPEAFEDDGEPEIDGKIIESLLQNLDDPATANNTPKKAPETLSLDSLIGTLEGTDEAKPEKKQQKVKFMGFGSNQLQIDAGQNKFGLVECKECGFSYNTNVPEDEKLHNKHHQAMTTIPRFRGWKDEDAMTISEWKEQNGRIIHLPPGNKKISTEHVTEIISKMELEFGSQDDHVKFHVYLAAYDSKLVGIALIDEHVLACDGADARTVRLGVKRIFVRTNFRRKGFASALLKTIAIMHNKGELLNIQSDMAFSTPTDDGKKLIKNIIGSDEFFVFN